MNTKQMDCVLELANTLHFGHAAANLFMSQPALSYQVKALETEIGFVLFERNGRGASLTPAGAQFCLSLRGVRDDLRRAVEQGQNVAQRYRDALRVGLSYRSALPQLPRAIARLAEPHPQTSVTPVFSLNTQPEDLVAGDLDVLFALAENVRRSAHVTTHLLPPSRIKLITRTGDALARKDLVQPDDLRARTLMVGGGSPAALRAVQRRMVDNYGVEHFNSNDHDTTLVNVAAGKGVCLAPDFLDDHTGAFAWTPFACNEVIDVVLCTRRDDHRPAVTELVDLLLTQH